MPAARKKVTISIESSMYADALRLAAADGQKPLTTWVKSLIQSAIEAGTLDEVIARLEREGRISVGSKRGPRAARHASPARAKKATR